MKFKESLRRGQYLTLGTVPFNKVNFLSSGGSLKILHTLMRELNDIAVL